MLKSKLVRNKECEENNEFYGVFSNILGNVRIVANIEVS